MKIDYTSIGDFASAEAPVGVHCILEMYQCAPALLNDPAFILRTVDLAAQRANSTLLKIQSHAFEPHGVTVIALLAESHLSIHTWPERGYVAADIFTCGQHTDPQGACQYLVEAFRAGQHILSVLPRGGRVLSRLPLEFPEGAALCQ